MGSDATWEARWAPYDEETYARALAYVPPGAVVLDIGAGDLRFARRLAARARLVYAVERRPELLAGAAAWPGDVGNVRAVCADARDWPFPPSLDAAVLLMRHCAHAHFALYGRKLAATGCRWLITNARWRMGVECIDLSAPAQPYERVAVGWYACRCGATGFRAGPVEALTEAALAEVYEVEGCPECKDGWSGLRLP
ncbi:MAG TPA: class I SAM-dependent methyltransferase [Promineifilum sp.]|nr:class I SAM-dependent methyltransferase [Promineifilum sp.]HQF69994.1 class I SAM-dependent methyltransferase [Promineifilum sp.]